MIKKTKKSLSVESGESSFSWSTGFLVAILAIIIILLATEYFYQIPSHYFRDEKPPKVDITRPVSSPGADTGVSPDISVCTREYMPVCGDDDQTYSNACLARSAGANIQYDGACRGTDETLPMTNTASVDTPPVSTPNLPVTDPALGESPDTRETMTAEKFDATYLTGYLVYSNTSLGYRIALPKYVYYQGYGARDGANHSIAVSLTSTGVEAFDSADVRVYYYKGSAPSDVMAGATRVDTTSGVLIIDSANSTNPRIQKIVETLRESAY